MLVMQTILHDKLILYQLSTVKKRDFSVLFCLNYKHFDNQSRTTPVLVSPIKMPSSVMQIIILFGMNEYKVFFLKFVFLNVFLFFLFSKHYLFLSVSFFNTKIWFFKENWLYILFTNCSLIFFDIIFSIIIKSFLCFCYLNSIHSGISLKKEKIFFIEICDNYRVSKKW